MLTNRLADCEIKADGNSQYAIVEDPDRCLRPTALLMSTRVSSGHGRNSTLAKIVPCSALRLQTIKNAALGPKDHAALSLGHRLRFVSVIVALRFRSVATVVH